MFAELHDTNAFTFHCVWQVELTLEEAAARRLGGTLTLPLVNIVATHCREDCMVIRPSPFHDFCKWDSLKRRPQLEDALSLPLALAPGTHFWSSLHSCMTRMASLLIVSAGGTHFRGGCSPKMLCLRRLFLHPGRT